MKRLKNKIRGITKGMPSAVVLSIAIHVGLFLLAGMLVVFTVVKKEEQKFVPPKAVERPKMKLRKPKVKVKKSAKPKPTTRIVTKINRASMPDIQLPEMSGMTAGLEGGIGGFDMMPDFSEGSIFGEVQSIGNDLKGTFYDFTRDRGGKPLPAGMSMAKCIGELQKFVRSGWSPSVLSRYYRSPNTLYATTIAIPPVQAILAPRAFGEPEVGGYCWAVHYEGDLVYKDDITFRFWGLGDDVLIVRVDDKVVLHAPYPRNGGEKDCQPISPWQTSSAKSRMYWLGDQLSVVGDWITLEAGVPLDMEVLIGEVPGGLFQAMLVVEVEGEEFPRNPDRGGPVLPIFKTSPLSIDMVETIHAALDPGDACVTNGPIFCDYEVQQPAFYLPVESTNQIARNPGETESIRIWVLADGKKVEGRFKTMMGDTVVVENARKKQLKIPFSKLSPDDRKYAQLALPAKFSINFNRSSRSVPPPKASPFVSNPRPLQISDLSFKTNVKQASTKIYPHELEVEFFAIGEEVDGDNYVLLDRRKGVFVPSAENKGVLLVQSPEPIRIQTTAIRSASPMRGTKYGGYLVVVRDERGRIIQHKSSSKWLFECLENLKKLPVGKHFDKRGIRVGPPRPGSGDRPSWV